MTRDAPWITKQIGLRFGMIVVLSAERTAPSSKSIVMARVRCDCGTEKLVIPSNIKKGLTRSCGCGQRASITTHGMSKSPEFAIWSQMIQRCTRPRHKHYRNYGARGIKVCDRWLEFENFYADMGPKPRGMSLDRKNNDGDYSPDNCRWATQKEQCNNVRRNRVIEFDGQKLTATQWAERLGIKPSTVLERLSKNLPLDLVLSTTTFKGRRTDLESR